MRKLISTILALCMVLCLLPVTAAADDADPAEPTVPTETVKLDVGGEDADNSEYYVGKDIKLRKDGVVYELTGTTDKKLQMWGQQFARPCKDVLSAPEWGDDQRRHYHLESFWRQAGGRGGGRYR